MKRFISLMLLSLTLTAHAQSVDNYVANYCVRYERQHLFLQKDSDLNVVDYDLEWPDIINFNDVMPLKRYISKLLLGVSTSSVDSVVMVINRRMGDPVTKQFKEIPDDRRFCYADFKAQILSYVPNRFIAYRISASVKPESLSGQAKYNAERYVLYDINNQNVNKIKHHFSDAWRLVFFKNLVDEFFPFVINICDCISNISFKKGMVLYEQFN